MLRLIDHLPVDVGLPVRPLEPLSNLPRRHRPTSTTSGTVARGIGGIISAETACDEQCDRRDNHHRDEPGSNNPTETPPRATAVVDATAPLILACIPCSAHALATFTISSGN